MIRKTALLLCVLALLTGCGPAKVLKRPEKTVSAPETTETSSPEVSQESAPQEETTPTSPPEPMTPEEAAILYARFLQDDVTALFEDGEGFHSLSSRGIDYEYALETYLAQDLTGDGIPELFINGPGRSCIWSIQDRRVVHAGNLYTGETILPNGAVFYHRPGGAPHHDRYQYSWFSPDSRQLPELTFSIWDGDDNGVFDLFVIGDDENVTEAEWNEITAPYFALLDADSTAVPFLDWVDSLGVTLPEPEMNPDKAHRIFENYIISRKDRSFSTFYLWDFDGDGIPELYENEAPYFVYGITGLHVECLGTAEELGGVPEEAPRFLDAAPVSTPAPEAAAEPACAPAGDSDENVLLSLVDFSSYEAQLDEADWTALSGFFPVLTGAEPFWGEHLSSLEESVSPPQEMFLPDFFQVLLGADLDGRPFPYRFESFALCDLDGDGERELALWSSCAGGWYVVLRREADGFYGAYMPVRWFAGLQQNGVFCGIGAMANVNYETLRFSEGHFYFVTLGSTSYHFGEDDTVHYYIGEAEVSQEDFARWLDNLLAGDAVWHSARASNFT